MRKKLAWVNRHYLKQASAFRLAELVRCRIFSRRRRHPSDAIALEYLASVMPIASESVDRLDQVPARLGVVSLLCRYGAGRRTIAAR
jgi:hypothetical protein